MQAILSINKPIGFTPNQIIEFVRQKYPHFSHEKIGYAGRLDPMARGLLLLMVGAENFNREKYLNLDKTYQFTALLGVETDSYDLLGIVKNTALLTPPDDYQQKVASYVEKIKGTQLQPYPPFSTKPVDGKELFKWAREDKIDQIEIPTKEIKIYQIKQLESSLLTPSELKQKLNPIKTINGVFRQTEILSHWDEFLKANQNKKFVTITFEVSCSSGTYVRSIVHNLGQLLGCKAVTIDINRIQVGTYSLKKAINLNDD